MARIEGGSCQFPLNELHAQGPRANARGGVRLTPSAQLNSPHVKRPDDRAFLYLPAATAGVQ
jgi:hypothetical protein